MGSARFTILTPTCVRVEWSRDRRFIDEPTVFASRRRELKVLDQMVVRDEDRWERVMRVKRGGEDRGAEVVRLTYRPTKYGIHEATLNVTFRDAQGQEREWYPGKCAEGNLGGTLTTLDCLRGPSKVETGLLSRDGWSVIDDSCGHVLMDGWVRHPSWLGYKTEGRIDWYVLIHQDGYQSAFDDLMQLSGRVPMPRRYVLGSWFSRYWAYTSGEYRGIVSDYHQHDFPLDVMVLDMDWHSGSTRDRWTGWSWNRELLPDAEELVSWLHEHELAVTLNLHPSQGVMSWEDRYKAFMEGMGADPITGECVEFDAGNRRYMESLFEQVLSPLEDPGDVGRGKTAKRINGYEARPERARLFNSGVDFWWLDWQQEQDVRSVPGLTNLTWLNRQFYKRSRRMRVKPGDREGASQRLRGQGFSRWAGWGDHRHPIHFSGDAHTGWGMLGFEVEFTISSSNAGCFFWSHDIGGHFGPRVEETAARWMQFGALSAALRVHSSRVAELDPRPWACAPKFTTAIRKAFELRARLMPTIYSAAERSCRLNTPLVRGMYLDWPDREEAYRSPTQYMLGRDVLCAPIVEPGRGERCAVTRRVYVPRTHAGIEIACWHDLVTGERRRAGSEGLVRAEIDRVPMFVPGGVPIVLQPRTLRMTRGVGMPERNGDASLPEAAADEQTLIVRIFPGVDGQQSTTELYEDDGVTLAYESGGFARTPIEARWSSRGIQEEGTRELELELRIRPTEGGFEGQLAHRRIVVEIGGVESVEIMGNGRVMVTPMEGREGVDAAVVSRLMIGSRGIREEMELRFGVRVADMAHDSGKIDEWMKSGHEVEIQAGEPMVGVGNLEEILARSERIREELLIGVEGASAGVCAGRAAGKAVAMVMDTHGLLGKCGVRFQVVDMVNSHVQVRREEMGEMDVREGRAVFELSDEQLEVPPIGRESRRVVCARVESNSRAMVLARVIATRRTPMTQWKVIGPFSWDWRRSIREQRFWPEKIGDTAEVKIAPGTEVGSRAGLASERWGCDLRKTFEGDHGLAYARSMLRSREAQSARLEFESADKLEVWVNKEKVFSQDGHATKEARDSFADIQLKAGENEVLVKCPQGWGQWGMSVYVRAMGDVEEIRLS